MKARKRAIPQHVRRAVALRYGCRPGDTVKARCHYCSAEGKIVWHRLADGQPSAWVSFPDLHLDHVIPEAAGGSTNDPDNFVLACRTCNVSKGHRFTEPLRKGSQNYCGDAPEELRSHSTQEGKRKGREGKGREKERANATHRCLWFRLNWPAFRKIDGQVQAAARARPDLWTTR